MRLSIRFSRIFLILSDKISQKFFVDNMLKNPGTFLAEIGVNNPYLVEYILKKKNIKYIGFEPNPVNFRKYNLNNYGVFNKAVTINKEGLVDFYLPIFNEQQSNQIPETGKGSLISGRHKNKELKVKVESIQLKTILEEHDINAWWIDAEGLSVKILSKILDKVYKPNFIYVESEANDENLIKKIISENKSYYIVMRARTSHNQNNYLFFKRKLCKNKFYISLMNLLLRIFELFFISIFSTFKIGAKIKNYLIINFS